MPVTPGSDTTAVAKLAAATQVPEPPNLAYEFTPEMWNYSGPAKNQTLNFGGRMTALRLDLNTTQSSTIEVDLQDDDRTFLSHPLFANWAFNIEDVSLSSYRKFNIKRLTANVNNEYLGDESDLEWVLGQRPIDTQLGNVYFRLCNITTASEVVTLSFEDRVAAYLRTKSGQLAWDRSQHTRAQFVAMLCRQAGVDYFIPEINVTQPIDQVAADGSGSMVTTSPAPSSHTLSSMANLRVKGALMSPTQRKIANTICQIGEQLQAPAQAIQACLLACIYESDMGTNPSNHGVLSATSAGLASNLSSAVQEITAFYQGGTGYTSALTLVQNNPSWSILQIATAAEGAYVQGTQTSQYSTESFPVSQATQEAQEIYGAFGGVSETKSTSTTTTSNTQYAFTRGANEDSWDCIQRLAAEVGWYAFARQNKLWFVSGNYLFQQTSQMVVEVLKAGVKDIDMDLDMGARDQTAQIDVYVKAKMWTALPGMMVSVKNRGPATGKWMVSEVQGTLIDETQYLQATCYKPVPKQAEPIDDTTVVDSTGGTPLSSGNGTAINAFDAAQALSAKKLIYTESYRTLAPLSNISQGQTLYDCSASVSEVLLLAGFSLPGGATYGSWAPTTASDWASVMKAGKGQYMTVWIDNTTGNTDHMFIEFNIPGKGHFQGNTVNPFGKGFGLFPWNVGGTGGWGGPNPASAFIPYHYPGT